MKYMNSRGVEVHFIDEAIVFGSNNSNSLLDAFSGERETPILKANTNHPYVMIYRVCGPLTMIPNMSHCLDLPSELVGERSALRMTRPEAIQIEWPMWPQPFKILTPRVNFYDLAPNWGNIAKEYLVLTAPHFHFEQGYCIVGSELCRKQLELWNVKDSSIEFLL